MNEDIISNIYNGQKGIIILEIPNIKLDSLYFAKINTKNQIGGLSEFYKNTTSFTRSFFPVISNPSCFKVKLNKNEKFIVYCESSKAIPKIINEKYKKK